MRTGEPFSPDDILPASLHGFLTISEFDHADFLVSSLFRRKFGHPPPDLPRHLVALYRAPDDALHLAGFSHMRPFGDVYLSGGSCTEGETIRRMRPQEREALHAAGGVWYWILKYAFRKYADCCDAFFGHCGDARALEVALAAGFETTGHEHVIAHWHKPLHPAIRRALIAKVHALGKF
ncbi:MAG TPA: hypothetical protein VFG55_03215 [Rhodanobacteraceae bacterium]|nr:hypothetical protein [Rhodanobacteraceae bacterium]